MQINLDAKDVRDWNASTVSSETHQIVKAGTTKKFCADTLELFSLEHWAVFPYTNLHI